MTFEQWFEEEYGSKPDPKNELAFIDQVAKAAWEAGHKEGQSIGVSAQVAWQDYLDRYDD